MKIRWEVPSQMTMVESFLQRKIYQIIAVMDSRRSNQAASNMPILIWIPKVQTCTVIIKNILRIFAIRDISDFLIEILSQRTWDITNCKTHNDIKKYEEKNLNLRFLLIFLIQFSEIKCHKSKALKGFLQTNSNSTQWVVL